MSFRKPRHLAAAVLGVVLVGVLAASAWAAAGDLDPSWNGTGYVTTPFAGDYSFADGVGVQGGGKVVAVGGVALGASGDFAIARYNKDGTLDESFGTGGQVTTDFDGGTDLATAVAFQGDKIVVIGYTSPGDDTYYFAIARYKKDGTLDGSFGTGGKVVSNFSGYDFANGVTVEGDKIVLAGATRVDGGPNDNNFIVARYKKDGTLDASFGTGGIAVTDFNGGNDSAGGVRFQGDRIVAGGYVQGDDYDFGLAKYKKDGTLDTSFGGTGKVETDFGNGNDFGHAVDVKGNRILLVGESSNGGAQDFAAAVYDKGGTLDSDFNGSGMSTIDVGGYDAAFGGAWGPGDTVVAGGFSDDAFAVARWTKAGAPDGTFGAAGSTTTSIGGFSLGFALDNNSPENKIVIAGFADDDFAVARYLNK